MLVRCKITLLGHLKKSKALNWTALFSWKVIKQITLDFGGSKQFNNPWDVASEFNAFGLMASGIKLTLAPPSGS